ncbi:MAG: translation initiation factor IF-2 [Bacteroidales bacterium]|nr:translation initiation factor IF-2 [Bacteroidales bacterium]
MTENDNIRINKVLKEFNIGLGTLVEFLRKKGISIDSNPGAKLTGEQYALVAKEFKKEQIVKAESKKVAIKVKDITDKEPKAIEEKEPEKELFVKTTVTEVRGPKILGKIDLDKPKAEPKQEVKVEEKPQPVVETKPVEKPVEKPEVKPQPEVKAVQTPKVEQTPVPPTAKPQPEAQAKESEKPQSTHIETKYEQLAGVKTVGKIDLTAFDKDKKKGNFAENKNKGKRERIHKKNEKVDVVKEAKQNNGKPGNNNGQNNGKPGNGANPNAAKQQGGKNQNNGKGNKKEKFKPVKVEVDEDAVQKQIKETYQRMVEGKGKTKGSKYRKEKREQNVQRMMEEEELEMMNSNILKVTEFVTVNDLSTMMNTPVIKVIEACMNLGLMVSINQRLDAEALVLVAEEFGYKIEFVTAEIQETIDGGNEVDTPDMLEERPPIVTVMGHVDHGKTSLLDYIRKANVIAGEAGGITQHIGAYNVKLPNGRKIAFLDTPGHEAFTAMRARGAKVTDLAIIIVAADDAIMPQTIEAISHAQAAGCPMIFAINKIDKPAANPDKIREQLSQMNILVEDWGGKYQCQEISAKQGIGIEELLEKVLLEADMLELKANPNKKAVGTVIESSLDKGRGYLATILVQAGTLRVGDVILSGCYTGKVKAMFNERGQKVAEAGPSTPVSILGLNGAPNAGETFNVFDDEKEAKDIANKREQLLRIQGLRTQKHITLEEIGRRIAIGNFQELNVIIKGDVDGSIEALSDSLIKLSTEEIHVNVIHKAVGAISESDVLLAAASNAIIIGFQVRPSANARKLADNEEIEIRLYSVIYDAINEVKSGIEGMLAPEEKEEVTATAEVRETFKISKVGTIAGCMVKEGKLTRNAKVRVIRDGIVIYTGSLGSLKRFKDDVKEVNSGYDCGLNIDGYNDIKVGDVVEAYQIVEIKRTL